MSNFDLATPAGRREAIMSTLGIGEMSLVGICDTLRLKDQSAKARMRTALNNLERNRQVTIVTAVDGRPVSENNSVVFRIVGKEVREAPRPAKAYVPDAEAGSFVRAARAHKSPIIVPETPTASMVRNAALSLLASRIIPGMKKWETVRQTAARTRIAARQVREAIRAGLHQQPPLLLGWTPTTKTSTQRLGKKSLYAPCALADTLAPPETRTAARKRKPALEPYYRPEDAAALATDSTSWETPVEVAIRTGRTLSEVGAILRMDAALASPSFVSWSVEDGRGAKRYRADNRYLPVALKGKVRPPRRTQAAKAA